MTPSECSDNRDAWYREEQVHGKSCSPSAPELWPPRGSPRPFSGSHSSSSSLLRLQSATASATDQNHFLPPATFPLFPSRSHPAKWVAKDATVRATPTDICPLALPLIADPLDSQAAKPNPSSSPRRRRRTSMKTKSNSRPNRRPMQRLARIWQTRPRAKAP